jgi:3-methyladenine DNA glycosylase AlkC
MPEFKIPEAPASIKKGFALKSLLDKEALDILGQNIQEVDSSFNKDDFIKNSLNGLEPLTLTQRSKHISEQLKTSLPPLYSEALAILFATLSPPLVKTEKNGLAPLFYMPHCDFIGTYGVDKIHNGGKDPFTISMKAQYEFTQRFTCEFSIRSFLIKDEARVLKKMGQWIKDSNPHVRRLCSEGTRPRLPWATKIDSFVKDPTPTIKVLELLKNDPDLYVRRSVANHVGDIAKDHLQLALDLCEKWLDDASPELKWVIRHAVRNSIKKGNERAIELRILAK